MSKPWEKYASAEKTPTEPGPWEKYASTEKFPTEKAPLSKSPEEGAALGVSEAIPDWARTGGQALEDATGLPIGAMQESSAAFSVGAGKGLTGMGRGINQRLGRFMLSGVDKKIEALQDLSLALSEGQASPEQYQKAGIDPDTPQDQIMNSLSSAFDRLSMQRQEIAGKLDALAEDQRESTRLTEPVRESNPMASAAGEMAGVTAPALLVPGGGGSLLARTIAGAGAGAGIGQTAPVSAETVEKRDEQRADATVMGAAVGGLAPPVFQGVVRVLAPIFSKRPNLNILNEDGSFSEEALRLLKKEGGAEKVKKELRRSGVLSAEEAERFNILNETFRPTRAQVTQKAYDFVQQQEIAKQSGPVRTAVETQDQALSAAGQRMASDGFYDAYETGESVARSLNDKAQLSAAPALQIKTNAQRALESGQSDQDIVGLVMEKTARENDVISSLYNTVKRALPDQPVDVGRLMAAAKTSTTAELEGGKEVAKAVLQRLRQLGLGRPKQIIAPSGLTSFVDRKLTVGRAEEVRQFMNELYESADGRGRHVIRKLKNALDEDVIAATGKDFFAEARAAKVALEASKKTERLGKTDISRKSIISDLAEGKIEPEQAFEKLVLNKSVSLRQIKSLDNFVGEDEPGKAALENLKSQTGKYLLAEFDKGGSKALDSAIDRIGKDKVSFILKDRMNAINQLKRSSAMLKNSDIEKAKSSSKIVSGILEGKISPDSLFESVVVRKSGSLGDLMQLKKFIGDEEWEGLKKEAVKFLFSKATSANARTEAGEALFSSAQFDNAIKQIGERKLKLLLGEDGHNAIQKVAKAARMRTPKQGAFAGKGPSAVAIGELKKPLLKRLPWVGGILDEIAERKSQAFMVDPQRETIQALEQLLRGQSELPPAVLPALTVSDTE